MSAINYQSSNVRGHGANLKANKLAFGMENNEPQVVKQPKIIERIIEKEVMDGEPEIEYVDNIIEKVIEVEEETVTGDSKIYFVSCEERHLLQDNLFKIVLLTMENNRLNKELQSVKRENEKLVKSY